MSTGNLLGRLHNLGVWPTISFQVAIKHTQKRVVQVPRNKTRIRATPVAVVCNAQVQYEVDRPHSVRQISLQLDVSTPLTPAPVHLLCLYLGACAKRSASCSTIKSFAFLTPECAVHVATWSPRVYRTFPNRTFINSSNAETSLHSYSPV